MMDEPPRWFVRLVDRGWRAVWPDEAARWVAIGWVDRVRLAAPSELPGCATRQDRYVWAPHNFQRFCRWCHGDLPRGRRSWCSDECVAEYMARKGAMGPLADLVHRRDGGRCALCGCDTEQVERIRRWAVAAAKRLCADRHRQSAIKLVYEAFGHLGFDQHLYRLWQADHIVPRCLGGPDDLANLRTLCQPCHKDQTATLAATRARRRRTAEASP